MQRSNIHYFAPQPLRQAMQASQHFHYAPRPNCRFNADANTGHAFGIFMASVGALRASRSGAAYLGS